MELHLEGLDQPVVIRRDEWGIPHVLAGSSLGAWFGLGYACAQDRLWQMESDRRRAAGRWAEVVGSVGVAGDRLARRLRLETSARLDVSAMSDTTRRAFESYSAGVNAYIRFGQCLPPEFVLAGLTPEPWEAWHSVAAFKIRHVLMGTWQVKLAQSRLLSMIGPDAYSRLDARPPIGSPVIVPPRGAVADLFEVAVEDLVHAASCLGFMADSQGGSNSWAVHGSKTVTGLPLLCNDSHRQPEIPDVYWQAHITCPEFDVVGATFAGLPGFPHFGCNGRVAWNITHAMADYQDLYVEQFDTDAPERYRVKDEWAVAEQGHERIGVRGAPDIELETWATRHGPIVHGDPRTGFAIALRYTATDGPCRTFEVLLPMLGAGSVPELLESQRDWVDPVNNLVCADVLGNIGYLTRGVLPIRSSGCHRQLSSAGWTDESEWIGRVRFEDMPRMVNPEEGFIATANQPILETDEPYISHSFAEPFRAERIIELLSVDRPIDVAYAAQMQGDVVSTAARRWVGFLLQSGPLRGAAERARQMLIGWDANVGRESAAALLYGAFRREVARTLFEPMIGPEAWRWLATGDLPAHQQIMRRWLAAVISRLDTGAPPPNGSSWSAVLQESLASAWASATAAAGEDARRWRWEDVHRLILRHPLEAMRPGVESSTELGEPMSPLPIGVGGDGDTIQCAGYLLGRSASFDIVLTSVYRQVVDLADVASASYVVPGGASGSSGSAHYADQLGLWGDARRVPMLYAEGRVAAAVNGDLRLVPA